jgi:hypothetical protein
MEETIPKPVRTRLCIHQDIVKKQILIRELKTEIAELQKEGILLSDETQRFEEKEEEITISKRPKKLKSD